MESMNVTRFSEQLVVSLATVRSDRDDVNSILEMVQDRDTLQRKIYESANRN